MCLQSDTRVLQVEFDVWLVFLGEKELPSLNKLLGIRLELWSRAMRDEMAEKRVFRTCQGGVAHGYRGDGGRHVFAT